MKYRIKIITYNTGRKEYFAQVKNRWFGWSYINCDGKCTGHNWKYSDRKFALEAIDLHFNGNSVQQSIEFEYITKN